VKLKPVPLFILFAIFITAACNPARKLADDQYLLNKNTIVIDSSSVSKEDLKTLYKQKPNRKILGVFRFHLWFYNLFDKEKIARDKAEWVIKTEKKNEIRRAKGEKEKSTDKLIGREKLMKIGEEPAILDSSLTERTRKQLELYLFRKGFFHATVSDSTVKKKNRMADVTYYIHCNQPYSIRNIEYFSRDSVINVIINNYKESSLIHQGDHYDEDVIENERERLTGELRNRGYYFFNKNYITFFDQDSSLNSNQVDIYLYANRLNENVDQSHALELTTENHHPYHLNNIYVQADFNPREPNAIPPDTSFYNGYYFLKGIDPEQFRRDVILRTIFMKQGDLFNQNDLDFTYNRLLDLSVFKFIKILFTEVPRSESQKNYLLNVNIQLTPLLKQDYSVEAEATNSGGNLGLAGSLSYRNKNRFKGAELLEIKVKGGLEALRNFNDSAASKKLLFFNTYELGPELNLTMKKFLLLPHFIEKKTSRFFNPKTNFSVGFNYQSRPDFTRSIVNGRFGWDWRQDAKQTWSVYLADVNSVKVSLSDAFNEKLISINDQSLINSYKTHITVSSRGTYVFTNQGTKLLRSFFYVRGNAEISGLWLVPLVLAPMSNGFKNPPTDDEGRKTIFGIPYSQFFKPDVDASFHHRLNLHNVLVYRIALGIGIEGPNSTFLPFEKSFFGGGANSLRAWVARTVGPGSYRNTINIEQSGDLKIETNIEMRSSFIKILEGAAFIDAGNIWTRKFDEARPGAQFEPNSFMNQLAIGAGLGLRFDFSFFILRLDGAVKIHDPELDLNERWVYSNQKFQPKDITLNLAIGYPF
jgi:outer membrane protein assembly factor BamA